MCGICGIFFFNGETVNKTVLERMMVAMKHRGPDDQGHWVDANVGLAHVRLSIIDLSSAGHQPMFTEDGRYSITYNGEIYNYIELREELQSQFSFRTQTDTEVILRAFQKWGNECLHHLNGMFAFAIFDKVERKLFIARDRFGIKPLFYHLDKDKLVFASDIPPIIEATKHVKTNDQIIYDYLVYNRTNHNEDSFFSGIKRLLHGHSLSVIDNKVCLKKWYDLASKIREPYASTEEYKEALNDAIRLQLRSDVPIGACLSGGLDSSSIVSCVKRFHDIPDMHTFSAVYNKGEHGDESDFIEQYKGIIENLHFARPSGTTLSNDLNKFVSALVEPVTNTSEYAEYKLMELAKQHVTVLLNGQGADEQMAGYLYFAGFYYKELLKSLKLYSLARELYLDVSNHRKLDGLLAFVYFSVPSFARKIIGRTSSHFLNPDFRNRHTGTSLITDKLYSSRSLRDSFVDHFEHKFEHHLLWADRSGMFFSLETRFPFLDHRLVERTIAMPSSKHIRAGWNKYTLREAMRGILPEAIRMRSDKVGYETPENIWFKSDPLRRSVMDIMYSRSFRENDYFDHRRVKSLYDAFLAGKAKLHNAVWKCINLELWQRQYINQ